MADDARTPPDLPSHEEDEPWIDQGEDEEALAAADAEAEADIEAGRLISNEAVMRWLESWGTANPLPRPKIGD